MGYSLKITTLKMVLYSSVKCIQMHAFMHLCMHARMGVVPLMHFYINLWQFLFLHHVIKMHISDYAFLCLFSGSGPMVTRACVDAYAEMYFIEGGFV